MTLEYSGLASDEVERLRGGGKDAYGQSPQRLPAEAANPCRHCLEFIEPGEPKLVLAYRPFVHEQPYAETGPIFLHANTCPRYRATVLPDWFSFLEPALIRGYDERDWIRYETGDAVSGRELDASCSRILEDPSIAYVHIRSKFGCYQCRVDRVAARR